MWKNLAQGQMVETEESGQTHLCATHLFLMDTFLFQTSTSTMYTPVKHRECSTAMTPIRHTSGSTQYSPVKQSTQSTGMSPVSHNIGTTQVTPVKCEDLAVGTIHFESHDTGIGTTPRRTIESHTIMTPKASLDMGTLTSPLFQVSFSFYKFKQIYTGPSKWDTL